MRGRCKVIAVNNNYEVAPWADILYACDLKWWHWHDGAPGFTGEKWTMDQAAAAQYGLRYIDGKPGAGLCIDPGAIHTGGNSGYQAINLAFHLGASHVILLGFDMKFSASGASHWFGDHPDNVRSGYQRFIEAFKTIADQDLMEVINCSRDTALTCFKQMTLKEALS